MALPPIHRLDAPMVYVFPDDGAWDDERYKQEIADMSAEDKLAHPLTRYVQGETRWDIAPVEEYLRPEGNPARFYLRRMTLQQWGRARDLAYRGELSLAGFYALQHGLIRVDGVPGLQHMDSSTKPFSEQDVSKIAEIVGFERAISVGDAIIKGNSEITEPEKKA